MERDPYKIVVYCRLGNPADSEVNSKKPVIQDIENLFSRCFATVHIRESIRRFKLSVFPHRTV